MRKALYLFLLVISFGMGQETKVSLVVLGTVQDGGSPHIGCRKDCCISLWKTPDHTRKVVSLGIVDHENEKTYLFEATPNFPEQLKLLKNTAGSEKETPDGIFLTHAHIGHYTGLMFLGREAMGSKNVPVFAMPKIKSFLEENGPWSQLVKLNNISIRPLENEQSIALTRNITVTPFIVPHRDEFSETAGFQINGPNKKVLFIPDIDKWSKWNKDIIAEIKKVDYAFLDATFFDGNEINNRNIKEIPHPFVIESRELFKNLSKSEKSKIHFIHFNHTNPLLDSNSKSSQSVIREGFNFSQFLDIISL